MITKHTSGQISASTTSGCAPLIEVVFSSSYINPQNINWDFGDGASAPTAQPTHTFATAGNYDVVFTATVDGNPVSHTITIHVFPKPIVAFVTSGPAGGCQGLQVSFDDNSSGGNGSPITGWNWSFGDGGVNTDNTPTPAYQYNIPGVYNVG
ncbi:MAG: PKD domain-containing protein, partial [Crocinitomicaceae bacterium]|nr:PKD domain-containing protein [Crocinitomicaceae bacterium]